MARPPAQLVDRLTLAGSRCSLNRCADLEAGDGRSSRRRAGARTGAVPGGSARRHDPLRPRRRGHQDRETGRRGDPPVGAAGARPERLFLGLQPRQEEPLPRPAHAARQGGLRRAGADRRRRARKLPSRHDGEDGVRLRPAARAEAGHHPDFGVGLRPIRPLSRAPGLRPARPGDERADVADRRAGRDAARRRHLAGRPLHLVARDDRHARRAAPPRPHRRRPAGRLLPDGFRR